MTQKTPTSTSFRRDGIPEVVSGLLWLLWGLAFLLPAFYPGWTWSGWGGYVLPLFVLLGALCVGPATRALKARFASGAAPPHAREDARPAARVFTLLFSFTLAAALVWVLLPGRAYEWQRLIPILLGILLAAIHAFIAWRHGLARYRLIALYILAAGALLSASNISPVLAFSLFLILLGIGVTASGLIALRRP